MTTVGLAMSVYNGAETIDDALASVADQTRRPDAIVVVDDGSTDHTADRVRAWQSELPITLLQQENGGVAAGRTAAVAQLDTDLVLALDADDVWLPQHLERLVDLHQRYGGIAAPQAIRWRPDHTGGLVARPARDLDNVLLMNSIFSGSLYERSDYARVGNRFRFDGCEDWDLWLRLMRDGVRVHTVSEPTVRYRVGGNSADDHYLPTECQVLETFLKETDDRHLRQVATRSLVHRRARLALRRSYDHAEASRSWAARLAVLGAFRGTPNVKLLALAMLLAPRLAWRARAGIRRRR